MMAATSDTVCPRCGLRHGTAPARPTTDALTRFLTDGRLEADNNPAENAMRVIALGRRNYLFADSDSGGERAASIYTLVATARLKA